MAGREVSPSHPGGILKRMHLELRGPTNTALAEALGVSRKTVSKIVIQRGGLNTEMALRLSRAFNTTPDLWLNLQRNYDLRHTARNSKDWRWVKPVVAASGD